MLSFYRQSEFGGKNEMSYVPVIPFGGDVRKTIDMKHWNLTDFTTNGAEVQYPTGVGIWDSNRFVHLFYHTYII